MAKRAQVGSGKETSFGKIKGAKEIGTPQSSGERDGIVKRVTTTACGVPQYGPGLAGGSKKRFAELKSQSFGNAGTGTPFDSDYDIVKNDKGRGPEPDTSKGEQKNR
jgi:hypothetical protein